MQRRGINTGPRGGGAGQAFEIIRVKVWGRRIAVELANDDRVTAAVRTRGPGVIIVAHGVHCGTQ